MWERNINLDFYSKIDLIICKNSGFEQKRINHMYDIVFEVFNFESKVLKIGILAIGYSSNVIDSLYLKIIKSSTRWIITI